MRVVKNGWALVPIALIALPVSGASASEVTLRAASFEPQSASFGWPFYQWVEEVNAQCAGQVQIQVLDAGSVSPFEQPNAVRTGVVDMASVPPAYYKGVMIEGDATVLGNVPIHEQRDNGAWEILNELHEERMNVHYLTAFGDGVRFHVYTRDAIEDGRLDGLNMRTSPVYDTFFRALGANPVQIPPPEVYTALERNVVDGYGWPLWGIFDHGWDEFTGHVYEPGFYNVMVNLLVNLDRWNSLSDEQQGCLTDMAIWLEGEWPEWRDSFTEEERQKIEDANINVVDLGSEFRQLANDLYWEALEEESPDDIPRIRELVVN